MNCFSDIETALVEIHDGWTSLQKAQMLASAVIALRASVSVEIGVFAGKGLVSLALAHKSIDHGMAWGIDPYMTTASIEGQVNPGDYEWWKHLDHESIYNAAVGTIDRMKLHPHCTLVRKRSQDFKVPEDIGVLRIDGNHGEQALNDVERYCPNVVRGGIVMLDDLDWAGNAVTRAAISLEQNPNWRKLYALEDSFVFQKL